MYATESKQFTIHDEIADAHVQLVRMRLSDSELKVRSSAETYDKIILKEH